MTCYDGFGQIWDGRPFWIGDFNGDGRADVLFYFPGDDNWWLGSHDGNQLNWTFAGNTARFGHEINDGRPFWIGNFSRTDRTQILFYYPGDDNWWLGSHDGNQLQWTFAGNTARFGHGINDGRPFWIGDFNGDGRADVLFYYPGDDNWWLGSHDGNQLQWTFAGNTARFGHGINDGRPFWIGDFNGDGRADVLFYYPGDDNWWLGSHDGNQLQWTFAGNTARFGHGINDGRPFWIGDFNGDGRADVLFYYPGDDNWWLGSHDGNQLQWTFAGNTARFGHGINDGRPFWIGNFSRADRAQVLFYYPGDGNWWLGSHDGNQLQWSFAGNTGNHYDSTIRLHLKILTAPNVAIDTMLESMREVYRIARIRVDVGSTENLNLPALNDLDVGQCLLGQTTAEQNQLFGNRNNVGNNDIVVYFVRSTVPPFNGCAAHPAGQDGAVVAQGATRWTLAHEVGHVLGLNHVNDNNRLMTGNGTANITNPPPDLVDFEIQTMDTSALTVNC
jgi:hypothetical protein